MLLLPFLRRTTVLPESVATNSSRQPPRGNSLAETLGPVD
jgi:hypothetical protein